MKYAVLLLCAASLYAQNTGAVKIIVQGTGGGTVVQQTGGVNYIPYIGSDTNTRAVTQDDVTGLLGAYYVRPGTIDYSTLLNRPTLFSGAYTDLSGKPSLFSGSYTDLSNKPALFSGAWSALTGRPAWADTFDGTYQSLGGTPPTGGGSGTANYISCGGVDDTATIVAAAPVIQLPTAACAVDAMNLPANANLRGPGTLKWISGRTGNAITESNANVVFDNLTVDLNGNLPAGASGGFFINGGNNFTIRNVRVTSTGAPAGMLNPAISVYNAGGLISNTTVDNTVKGEHLFINPNKRSDRKVLVDGWLSDGSNQNDIAVQNSGSEGPANVEITHFVISNVTDTNAGTGQQGNAVDTYLADGVTVHDGQVSNTRFSSVRFATSNGNQAYNIRSTGTQETAYYAELGGASNVFHDLVIENGVSGTNLTNVSQRANYPNDSPNTAYNITCRNMIDYCVQGEHDSIHDITVDGVPIGVHQGNGGTTGNNIVRNVTCTRTSTAYPNVDVCNALDVNIKSSAVDLVSGIATTNYTPLIGNIVGSALTSGNNITGITKANPAVISITGGTVPAVGSYVCFRQVAGMTQMNGLCSLITASSSSSLTTQIDSTGFGTFTAPTGGQKSWTMQFFNSAGAAQYTIPSNFVLSTDGTSGVFGSAQPTHPTYTAQASAGNPYAVGVGTSTPTTTNPEATPAGTTASGLVGNGTSDDTSALQAALNNNNVTILTAGNYKITSSLNLPANHQLFCVGNSGDQRE
jgi:hypothetical protein